MSPRVVSLNVGLPRDVEWGGKTVRTAIFKTPVSRRLQVYQLHLEGDEAADPKVHGGANKAVYAYPSEHYPAWREELSHDDLTWGAFGENLTTTGLLESTVCIGDRFRIGTAELVVTQPRMPCYKLGIRLNRPEAPKRLLESRRSGIYFAVVREGTIGPGDAIELIARGEGGITVTDLVDLYTDAHRDEALLRRAADSPALLDGWRELLRMKLAPRDAG